MGPEAPRAERRPLCGQGPECPRRPEGTGDLTPPGVGRRCPALGAGFVLASALRAVDGQCPGRTSGQASLGAIGGGAGVRNALSNSASQVRVRHAWPLPEARPRGHAPSGKQSSEWPPSALVHADPACCPSSSHSRPPQHRRAPPVRGNGCKVLTQLKLPQGCTCVGVSRWRGSSPGPFALSFPLPCSRCAARGPVRGPVRGPCVQRRPAPC